MPYPGLESPKKSPVLLCSTPSNHHCDTEQLIFCRETLNTVHGSHNQAGAKWMSLIFVQSLLLWPWEGAGSESPFWLSVWCLVTVVFSGLPGVSGVTPAGQSMESRPGEVDGAKSFYISKDWVKKQLNAQFWILELKPNPNIYPSSETLQLVCKSATLQTHVH